MIEGLGDDLYYGFLVGTILFLIMFFTLKWMFRDVNIVNLIQPTDEVQADILEPPPVYNPNCCPICIGGQSLALETNCGHLYCGPCLQRHYMATAYGNTSGIDCALCRQRVVLIFNCFTNEERGGVLDDDALQTRDDVLRFVRMYNRLVRNDLSLMERILELPVLLRHFVDDTLNGGILEANYLRLRLLLFFLGTIMYVLVPFDMFPEMIFGIIGYTEDAVVFFIMSAYIIMMYRNFVVNQDPEN